MNIHIQRNIDRMAGQPICRLLSLLPGKKKPVSPDTRPRNILIIMLSEMGSLVLAQPMLGYLREKFPRARIYALVFEKNRECLELFDSVPPQNIFTVNGDALFALLRDSIRVLRRIRNQDMDTVIDCELFSRISSIYSGLSGAGIRVGFHPHTQEGLYRGNFINRPVLYNPYQHISEQFVTLAHAVCPEAAGRPLVKRHIGKEKRSLPRLEVGRDAMNALRGRLMRDFPQVEGRPLILIYPGGGLLPIRAWPMDHYCRMAKDLLEKGYGVGIIGLKEDHGLAQQIAKALRSRFCVDLTGYTRSVKELITLFHLTKLLITNDGGPGHFAALTPIPSIILYGPETPVLYGPLGKNAVSLHAPVACSPCLTAYNHRNSPCDGNNVCLQSIPPETVLKKAYELLGDAD
ncbi:MAG: glycosyltransferase family 9 protein [Deltaproteobacteria bacterium]|nr:glycosyltransferase family 9 protein [Deltaproteobacteria bacterium]